MNLYNIPWKLVPNKIVRYPGGREIDRFRGVEPALDDGRPEAWVASDISVIDAATKGDPYDGRAEVILPDGRRMYLFQAIAENPDAVFGAAHQKISGNGMGVLVKLLDAQYQLGLQCHPTRAYAKAHFNSDYGKEESWIVIGLRDDVPEPPYVYLGFKEGTTREKFETLYHEGDVKKMEDCCHKIPVKVGDVFFVGAGLPHAIGAGCFVVEVQEPSDITVGWGRHGQEMGEEEGKAYDERLLGAYIYDGCSYDENLERWLIESPVIRKGSWGQESVLIGDDQTTYFSCTQLDVQGEAPVRNTGFIQVGIVVEGEGILGFDDGEMPLKKGDEFFIPYNVQNMQVIAPNRIQIMMAHPSGPVHKAE